MKLSTHVLLQVLALVIQGANMLSAVVPTQYKPMVVLAVTVAQAVIAFVAHYSTPPNVQ